MDKLKLNIGSFNIEGWKFISIRRNLENMCGGFNISLRYKDEAQIDVIEPEEPCKILIEDDELNTITTQLTGYIDTRKRTVSGTSTVLSVTGRDKTQDLIDCSAIVKSNTFNQTTVFQFASALCKPFGITVVDEAKDTTKFKEITIQSGESTFSPIERVCRQLGILPMTDTEGKLVLANTGLNAEKAGADLVVGKNVLEIEEIWDTKSRYSEYTVKGQGGSTLEWLKESTNKLKGVATDKYVSRYRPLVIMAESKATASSVQKRAKWEAQVRSGRSKYYQVKVKGWKKTNLQDYWEINTLTNLKYDKWSLNKQFLITSTEQIIDDSGRITIISLKDPSVYSKNPTGGLNV